MQSEKEDLEAANGTLPLVACCTSLYSNDPIVPRSLHQVIVGASETNHIVGKELKTFSNNRHISGPLKCSASLHLKLWAIPSATVGTTALVVMMMVD